MKRLPFGGDPGSDAALRAGSGGVESFYALVALVDSSVKVLSRRWLVVALGLLLALGALGFWALGRRSPISTPSLVGLGLKLRAERARVVSPLGVPFALNVYAAVSAPAGSAGGEWRTEISEVLGTFDNGVLTLDDPMSDQPSSRDWLRYTTPEGAFASDWRRALVCIRPRAGEIRVTAHLLWRGPGTSGFHDTNTGIEAATAISIQCEGPPSPQCGDGRITHDEECESTNLLEDQLRVRQKNGHRVKSLCALLGKGGGTLRCGSNCRYDTSGCVIPASCGNGSVDPGEECDGNDKGGKTCGSEGFSEGGLRCRNDCQLDVAGCRLVYE